MKPELTAHPVSHLACSDVSGRRKEILRHCMFYFEKTQYFGCDTCLA